MFALSIFGSSLLGGCSDSPDANQVDDTQQNQAVDQAEQERLNMLKEMKDEATKAKTQIQKQKEEEKQRLLDGERRTTELNKKLDEIGSNEKLANEINEQCKNKTETSYKICNKAQFAVSRFNEVAREKEINAARIEKKNEAQELEQKKLEIEENILVNMSYKDVLMAEYNFVTIYSGEISNQFCEYYKDYVDSEYCKYLPDYFKKIRINMEPIAAKEYKEKHNPIEIGVIQKKACKEGFDFDAAECRLTELAYGLHENEFKERREDLSITYSQNKQQLRTIYNECVDIYKTNKQKDVSSFWLRAENVYGNGLNFLMLYFDYNKDYDQVLRCSASGLAYEKVSGVSDDLFKEKI